MQDIVAWIADFATFHLQFYLQCMKTSISSEYGLWEEDGLVHSQKVAP
jgi:hypothetical protein